MQESRSNNLRGAKAKARDIATLVRRHKYAAGLAATTVVALVLGFGGGAVVVGSAQSERVDYSRDEIGVPVERGTLESSLVVRGTLERADSVPVGGVAVNGKVITAVPTRVGDLVVEGQVVVELEQRPLIVLQGGIPMFRDLHPGDSGNDVLQLNAALARSGETVAASQDVFNADTSAALRSFYSKAGYQPPEPAEESSSALKAAEQKLKSFDQGAGEMPVTSTAQAEYAVRAAERSLSDAQTSTSVSVQDAQSTVTAAGALLDLAAAAADEAAARADIARTGTDPDSQEAILPQRRDEILALEKSTEEAEITQELALETATNSLTVATQTADSTVKNAEDALSAAQQQLKEVEAQASTSDQTRQQAESQQTAAQEEYEKVLLEADTPLPLSEVSFVPTMPAEVVDIGLQPGDRASDILMQLGSDSYQVATEVTAGEAEAVVVGDTAKVSGAESQELLGVVSSIGEEPTAQSAAMKPVRIALTEPVDPSLIDTNVRVEIQPPDSLPDGYIVPIAAVRSEAGGDTYVSLVKSPDDLEVTELMVRVVRASSTSVQISQMDEISLDDMFVLVPTGSISNEEQPDDASH